MSTPERPEYAVTSLRERKKAKTRRTIQEQALRLFAEQGYDATTVEQIAEAAEISPSTFFRYFPTKEDVVIQDDYDPMVVAILAAQPKELSVVAAMRATIKEAFTNITAEEELQIKARTRLQISVPALRARMVDNMIEIVEVFGRVLAERADRPHPDPMLRTLAGAMVGVMIPTVFAWAESDDPQRLSDLMEEALTYLEVGFRY
jgi:AcrR family transcriptional regulator